MPAAAGVSGGVPALVLGSEQERLSHSDMELKVSAPDEPDDIVIVYCKGREMEEESFSEL